MTTKKRGDDTMMSIEDRLKEMIIEKYGTIRSFSASIDLPNSTVMSMLRRGVNNTGIDNVLKVCHALGISAEELADGRITPVVKESKEIDLADVVTYNESLTVDGEKLSQFERRMILHLIEMIRISRKEIEEDDSSIC
jgi:hypothetical protein